MRHDDMNMEKYFGGDMVAAHERGETYPARLTLAKGAVAFRDTRLWHHAVPNLSETHIRHMVAMVYARRPFGITVPRADPSVGTVVVAPDGPFGYFDGDSMTSVATGADYGALQFDEACRSALEHGSDG
eukprot:SAG31_NODE_19220_length_609_cov_0.805882_1_plen_128_part_01